MLRVAIEIAAVVAAWLVGYRIGFWHGVKVGVFAPKVRIFPETEAETRRHQDGTRQTGQNERTVQAGLR